MYLTSQTITHEDDYWEPSEITAQMATGIAWVDDADLTDTFIDRMRAESYLAVRRGEFWKGAKVVEK